MNLIWTKSAGIPIGGDHFIASTNLAEMPKETANRERAK